MFLRLDVSLSTRLRCLCPVVMWRRQGFQWQRPLLSYRVDCLIGNGSVRPPTLYSRRRLRPFCVTSLGIREGDRRPGPVCRLRTRVPVSVRFYVLVPTSAFFSTISNYSFVWLVVFFVSFTITIFLFVFLVCFFWYFYRQKHLKYKITSSFVWFTHSFYVSYNLYSRSFS